MNASFLKVSVSVDAGSSGTRCDVPWIGVDLDGTLAEYTPAIEKIGKPIGPMLARVRQWLAEGRTVKIFTARAAIPKQIRAIKIWLAENGLPPLEVTNVKDFSMIELWDDRCVQVCINTGMPVSENKNHSQAPGSQRKRNNSGSISKLKLAVGRFVSSWNQVPRHEFIPTSSFHR